MAGAALTTAPSLSERQSLVIVGAFHLVLLGALSLALRSIPLPPPPDEGVPIEVVLAADARAASVPPAPTPPPPHEPTPPSEPAPPPTAVPPPAPTPAPPETAKPRDDAAPPQKAKPDKVDKPEPKPLDVEALTRQLIKATPKPRPLDTDALAKTLAAAAPKSRPLDTAALTKSLDASLPKATALPKRGDPRVAAALAAAIKAQVTPCWTLPVGGGATAKVTALLHLTINRDGSIAGRPGLVSQTGVTGANAAYARAFAEAAARAVLRCAPLNLPADQFDQWAQVEINFDPANL